MKINRPVYLQKLIDRRNNGMIKIITGMRRSGKSYLLFNLFAARLEDEGIDKNHIIAIDLEDIYNEQLREPLPLLQHIDRQVKEDGTYYVLIDEVQLLDRFEEVLNTLLKRPNMDVYVTGSNARFLSKDVITTFRGRGDEVRVHPLSFGEYLSAQADSGFVERHLNDYMRLGGLPQTLTMQNEQQKRDYLQQLFKNTYLLDIKERYDIRNDDDLEELIDIVASGIGGLTNPTKITNTFKSVKQSTIARDTVKNYLDYMQDAFLIEKAVQPAGAGGRPVGASGEGEQALLTQRIVRKFIPEKGIAVLAVDDDKIPGFGKDAPAVPGTPGPVGDRVARRRPGK